MSGSWGRVAPPVAASAPPSVATEMLRQVSAAALPFESRWTLRALRRVNAELWGLLIEQRELFHEALVTGEDADIREQGAAMCRGWGAAQRALEAAAEADDAYILGEDPHTGTRVAIGEQMAAAARVRELHGERVIWLSPHEVAAMFAGGQAVARVKALFPGAEVEIVRSRGAGAPGGGPEPIDLYPDEPAKEEE